MNINQPKYKGEPKPALQPHASLNAIEGARHAGLTGGHVSAIEELTHKCRSLGIRLIKSWPDTDGSIRYLSDFKCLLIGKNTTERQIKGFLHYLCTISPS